MRVRDSGGSILDRKLTGMGIEKGTGTFWQYRCIGTGTKMGTGIGSTITCGFHSSADKKGVFSEPMLGGSHLTHYLILACHPQSSLSQNGPCIKGRESTL